MTDREYGTLTVRVEDPDLTTDATTLSADVDGKRLMSVTVHNAGIRAEHAERVGSLVAHLLADMIRARCH